MSTFMLRLLALITMVLDHAGLALLPGFPALRAIGRLSFPLACFLVSEGFAHTRDRGQYAVRLLALALVCEAPFDWLFFHAAFAPLEQNAGFSLMIGLMALAADERLRGRPARQALSAVGFMLLSMALSLRFGWLGPALCLGFGRVKSRMGRMLIAILLPACYALTLFLSGVQAGWAVTALWAVLSALPIALYSGRPGPYGRALQAVCYLAVPMHYLLLIALQASRLIPPWLGQ